MGHFKGTVKFTYLKFAAKVQQICEIHKEKAIKICIYARKSAPHGRAFSVLLRYVLR